MIKKIILKLFNNLKLRDKLIISFSVLAIFPVLTVGVLSLFNSNKYLMEAETNALTQSMFQLNNSLDYFFQTYMDRTNMAFSSEAIQELIKVDVKDIEIAIKMNQKITQLLNYIESDFNYPEMYKSFGNDGGLQTKLYLQNDTVISYGIVLPLKEILKETWIDNLFKEKRVFLWHYGEKMEDTTYVSLNRRLVNFDNGKDAGLLQLYIPKGRVERIIQTNLKNEKMAVYYLDEKQNLIATAGNKKYSNPNYFEKIQGYVLKEGINNVKIGKESMMIGGLTSHSTKWKIIYLVPSQYVTEKTSTITLITVVTIIVALFFCVCIAFKVSTIITHRIRILLDKTNEINEENLTTTLVVKGNDEISQLDKNFDKMIARIRNLIENVYLSQINASKLKLELLQEQINPHLLYNTLSMVATTAAKDNQYDIMTVSENLSAFYRGVLNHGKAVCTFKDELQMVKNYIEITKYVYHLDVDVILDVEDYILDFYTLKLIIQPVVENAILHGIRPKKYGTIIITGTLEQDKIIFYISDDGLGVDTQMIYKLNSITSQSEFNKSVGITNIIKRIKIFFGEIYGLKYASTKDEGTTVTLTLPKLTYDEIQPLIKEQF